MLLWQTALKSAKRGMQEKTHESAPEPNNKKEDQQKHGLWLALLWEDVYQTNMGPNTQIVDTLFNTEKLDKPVQDALDALVTHLKTRIWETLNGSVLRKALWGNHRPGCELKTQFLQMAWGILGLTGCQFFWEQQGFSYSKITRGHELTLAPSEQMDFLFYSGWKFI